MCIYMLAAKERAKARSLLDPSDQCDAKAFSPPISKLGFPILTSEPQLVLLLVPMVVPMSAFCPDRTTVFGEVIQCNWHPITVFRRLTYFCRWKTRG